MPPKLTPEQIVAVRSHLSQGRTSHEIAAEIGASVMQVAAVKAHTTMGNYSDDGLSPADVENELEDALEMRFGLERDLQLALRRNISQLEFGLEIIDGGKERSVASGRIDITTRDKQGTATIIELKAGTADWGAIGQIQAYMGDLMDDEKQVRGILVAQEFTARAVSAARRDPFLRLVEYRFQFAFETITGQA
jgi:RecB family endonuclease NucS